MKPATFHWYVCIFPEKVNGLVMYIGVSSLSLTMIFLLDLKYKQWSIQNTSN
jgi:hypothetical protein